MHKFVYKPQILTLLNNHIMYIVLHPDDSSKETNLKITNQGNPEVKSKLCNFLL